MIGLLCISEPLKASWESYVQAVSSWPTLARVICASVEYLAFPAPPFTAQSTFGGAAPVSESDSAPAITTTIDKGLTPGHSSAPRRRPALSSLCRFFAESRCCLAAALGLVLRRRFGGRAARSMSEASRAIAASRFFACVRCSRLSISKTPSAVSLCPARSARRALTASGRDDLTTSNRNSTAVATLLTF